MSPNLMIHDYLNLLSEFIVGLQPMKVQATLALYLKQQENNKLITSYAIGSRSVLKVSSSQMLMNHHTFSFLRLPFLHFRWFFSSKYLFHLKFVCFLSSVCKHLLCIEPTYDFPFSGTCFHLLTFPLSFCNSSLDFYFQCREPHEPHL